MIFEKIDQYIDNLALTSRLEESSKYLKEARQELQRLSEENADLINRIKILDFQLTRRRPIDKFMEESSKGTKLFYESLNQSHIENKIQDFIRKHPRVPEYFKDFIQKKQRQHLDNFLKFPNRWSLEQIEQVKKGIIIIQQRLENEQKKPRKPKWVVIEKKQREKGENGKIQKPNKHRENE